MPRDLTDLSDHVHRLATENGDICPVIDFDYQQVEGYAETEKTIPMAEASAALAMIINWVTELRDLRANGARAAALSFLLNGNGRYRSLSEIARETGVSRATISLWLLQLRDLYGIRLNLRGSFVRQNCRRAQINAVQTGTHASRYTRNVPRGTIAKTEDL